jgi:hypothetical protein
MPDCPHKKRPKMGIFTGPSGLPKLNDDQSY